MPPTYQRTFGSPIRTASLAFVLWATVAASAHASVTATFRLAASRVDGVPIRMADLTAEPWTRALQLDAFENLTRRTSATRYPTSARILLDDNNVYVAFHAVQSGVPITATQTTNDVGFGLDDYVGVGIDTTGNGQTYYFEATPAGVRYQQSAESTRYNPIWTAFARRTADSWDATLVIPIKTMRTPNARLQTWRFNLVRHIAAVNENETWAYDALMNDGSFPATSDARFWPYLQGVVVTGRTSKPKPRAELYALASAGHDRNLYQQASGLFEPQGTRHVGFDANVPITGTIAFVTTIAPDFSNVEVDQQTISPQEFRRSVSEYRPFFAQGANFFLPGSQTSINQPPNQLFYSPGIGEFERGAKIEGTQGLQSVGLLNVAGAGFNDSVLAFKHALPDRTFGYSIDAVTAHHQAGNSTAYPEAASDASYDATVFGRNLHNGFVYAFDYGAERGSVPGTTPRLAYKSENFVDVHRENYEVFVDYRDLGPKWNPVDGFTNVADVRGPGAFFDFDGTPKGTSPLKRAELFIFGDRLIDHSGAAHQSDFQVNADLVFKNLLHLSGGPSFSSLRYYGDGTDLVGYDVGYARGVTVPFNQHSFNVGYKDGTPTPYDLSTSWGPFETFHDDGTVRGTYLRSYSLSTSRPLGTKLSLGLEYDGTLETYTTASPGTPSHDGQQLRRISLGESLGEESNLSLSLREISGTGGFAVPGLNLAASYHRRFTNGNELFVNYGTPAASATVQRLILKYVLRLGSAAGT